VFLPIPSLCSVEAEPRIANRKESLLDDIRGMSRQGSKMCSLVKVSWDALVQRASCGYESYL
jgi:hypothetical protein